MCRQSVAGYTNGMVNGLVTRDAGLYTDLGWRGITKRELIEVE